VTAPNKQSAINPPRKAEQALQAASLSSGAFSKTASGRHRTTGNGAWSSGERKTPVALRARWRPAAGAHHDAVILTGCVQVVCPQGAPFEAALQLDQGLRLDDFVRLDRE